MNWWIIFTYIVLVVATALYAASWMNTDQNQVDQLYYGALAAQIMVMILMGVTFWQLSKADGRPRLQLR